MNRLQRVLATTLALGSLALSGCAGYNFRMSSLMIDRGPEKRDLMVGWGSLGRGGNYHGVGILNLALDNPWPTKLLPLYNRHTASPEEEAQADNNPTIQLGSVGICTPPKDSGFFQVDYLNFNNGPTYVCPLLSWRHGKK